MTSAANAQNVPAPNSSAPSATASYASAVGASGKAAATPVIVTGSSAPVVVSSSTSAPTQPGHHAKSSSVSPLNGNAANKSNTATMASGATSKHIVPAVPAVINGSSADHARKSSVTISAAGPSGYVANGGPAGAGPKAGMPKFGYESPAVVHSTPSQNTAAPIPIPGHQRIPSPVPSPSPIPQPSASGGRPPSTISQDGSSMKFGSLGGDGDRHMKHNTPNLGQNNLPVGNQSPHFRRGSTHSIHSDIGNHGGHGNHGNHGHGHHGGPGPNRGGYGPQAGRGRGYNNGHQFGNQSMGYPPAGGPYPRGPSQGRGGMPPQFQPRGMQPGFVQNSPQAARASPAMAPAVPNPGTPMMQTAIPANTGVSPGYINYAYQQAAGFPPQVNVNTPLSFSSQQPKKFHHSSRKGQSSFHRGGGKKKGLIRGERSFSQPALESEAVLGNAYPQDLNKKASRRPIKRWPDSSEEQPNQTQQFEAASAMEASAPFQHWQGPVPLQYQPTTGNSVLDDLSPTSGNFERLLTARKQTYQPYPGQYNNQGMMGYAGYGQVSYMPGPQQSPGPAYAPAYVPNPYAPPGPQPMSRNSSQVSERPNSSTGQGQVVSAGPGVGASVAGVPKSAPNGPSFVIPRKSAAIIIKNAQGEIQDFNALKAPASPGPNVPVSKTPPVIASTPTPPPKSVTPSHSRAESTAAAAKTAEQLRNEFKEQVRKTAEVEGEKAPESVEPAAAKAEETVKPAEKTDAAVEPKKTAPVAAKETAPAAAPKAVEEKKAPAPVVVKTETAAAVPEKKAEPAAPAAPAAAPAAAPVVDEEDETERMIREMEEAEAKREAEEAAYAVKKKKLDEEKKKKADADRIASAAENDRKLREQEREMERVEEERERQRHENEAAAAAGVRVKSVAEVLAEKISGLTLGDRKETAEASTETVTSKLSNMTLLGASSVTSSETAPGTVKQQRTKPSALNLAPINTKSVEAPQPSAALQSLKTARFLRDPTSILYPKGVMSPNPALNPAVNKKGNFKYDTGFLLQFKDVFVEKPSMDFDQQVKQLIGDGESTPRAGSRTPASGSVRQNSRSAGGTTGFTMGVMGEFASKTLPPGTTSDQRFAMSNGSMQRPPTAGMGPFGRPGSFPGPAHMSRTPSASMGGVPNSPRQNSRSTRGNSRRDNFGGKNEAQAAKTMPLTAGQELKPIAVSSNGWKPTSIGSRAVQAPMVTAAGMLDPTMVQRKVKAALNKMTPEKFDKISDQILEIALQSKDEEDGRTLRQVIQLTFEKATDEAHWASMYARFCKRMLDMMSPEIRDTTIKDKKGDVISGGTLFRKYLLNRCQEEFERGWKVDLPKPKEGESTEAVMLSDEYYEAMAAKRRGLGLVQFIGELYKLGMLTERIMHECVRKLVDYESVPDEAEIESLSKLLRTVGGNLDRTEKGRPMMDAYFVRIKNMVDFPDLPSRLKYMLMDILDLRSGNWAAAELNKGPKTLEEVRQEAEAAAAQKAAEAARSTSQRGPGGRSGMGGRNDNRNFSYSQPVQNQVGMDDLRRLKGSASRIASSSVPTLGPTSMFASRSNSGRRNGPGGSFGRPGDDSGPGSRAGTPLTRSDSNSVSHANAFSALAMDTDTPTSPPSTAASPAISKANLDKAKKDGN
ncbi:eukaryotic translation initiation factor subunit [Grosmannia clavigera kw1407]|uniref:Eukaryotic translation initiation factor subunit n=1 Tax=Grosmannia clavigera (strain kw1407 / UAMH 11150) TaxID=655863 RepID=F0XGC7_GROCL|nr:eukaryotic translation initiation factor subunit [Grosmannia clavigera kw1407]EFX02624.1 eukaryotic translation initiation factor subunit [Grosmannia clavigera kw1407]